MNFAIKTSSISKKHFTDGNTKSANELTPLKQTEYIETLETRVSMLENENSELRKEVEFLKNRLNKGYNRGMPKTTKVG
jgi:chaperonin cofactor prefoldin